ncbi:DUF1993 domain-containing protein [Sphingobium phenoxybenzoativorans]|uniref:DUF1993 domain-containing protein n=1 Tax=Sphingobium phenoxybenzoativorans TaxID=1592790 RepID=UPI0008727FFB|nr:DUF1993 domain-containing protein [Sphingobium phenoxybenzoativorans]
MAFTLYAATIPSCLQILGSMSRLLGKAEVYCTEKGWAPDALIEARLADDMLPFGYQVKSTAVHSIGAIEGVRRGNFSPDTSPPPSTFDGLRARVAEAIASLEAIDPDEVESFIGADLRFTFGDNHMYFLAEDFLLSFSQPNFYFHATTAYDILRMKGMEIGKRDFNGRVRRKPS